MQGFPTPRAPGHFLHLEKPAEAGEHILGWIR
jgi:hypothetical protein